MLVSDMNGQADAEIDYKRKYKNLKRKLKFLVYVSPILLQYTFIFIFLLFFKYIYDLLSDLKFGFSFAGARMLSGGAEESTEKASQDFQGQKVNSRYVDMTLGRYPTCYSNSACKQALFVF